MCLNKIVLKIVENNHLGPYELIADCNKFKKARTGQQTPVGNQRGERRHAPSPEPCAGGCLFKFGTGEELIAPGTHRVFHTALEPRREGKRRRSRYAGFKITRDVVVARVCVHVQRDENCFWGRRNSFLGAARGVTCAKGLRKSRVGCSGSPLTIIDYHLSSSRRHQTHLRDAWLR